MLELGYLSDMSTLRDTRDIEKVEEAVERGPVVVEGSRIWRCEKSDTAE